MNAEQNYSGEGASASPIEPTATLNPQTVPTGDYWQATFANKATGLTDYTRIVENCHRSRLMLRSWFLAQLNQGIENSLNPCGIEENTYLYGILDNLLAELVVEHRSAQAKAWFAHYTSEEVGHD